MKYVLILVIVISSMIYSQELNCKVTVNYEGLPVASREILKDFAQLIEDYMNKTKFLSTTWDGPKIECNLNIYFQSVAEETKYAAQVFIGSRRPIYKSSQNTQMVSIMDNSWSFSYLKGQALYSNQNAFDPITSFLDFYAFLMIGFDADSFNKLGGTPYFTKAADICNWGATSTFSNGWQRTNNSYNKKALVDDILNEKFRPFREAYFNYHYNGVDLYETNPAAAQIAMSTAISALEAIRVKTDLNSVFVRTFFDAKNTEIVDKMKTYSDKEFFNMLKRVDPGHISKYDEVLKNK